MSEQLTLWEAPASTPQIDYDQILTCASCGQEQRVFAFSLNHTTDPDRWCISKVLRRNHVTSYARAIATAGEWPGRSGSGPAKGWSIEKAQRGLADAIALAKEAGIDEALIAQLIAAEGIEVAA